MCAAKNIHQEKTMCSRKMLETAAPWGFFGKINVAGVCLAFCVHSGLKIIPFISQVKLLLEHSSYQNRGKVSLFAKKTKKLLSMKTISIVRYLFNS